jgi:hypothetical protein
MHIGQVQKTNVLFFGIGGRYGQSCCARQNDAEQDDGHREKGQAKSTRDAKHAPLTLPSLEIETSFVREPRREKDPCSQTTWSTIHIIF